MFTARHTLKTINCLQLELYIHFPPLVWREVVYNFSVCACESAFRKHFCFGSTNWQFNFHWAVRYRAVQIVIPRVVYGRINFGEKIQAVHCFATRRVLTLRRPFRLCQIEFRAVKEYILILNELDVVQDKFCTACSSIW